jgi:DNA polymerase III epsilon subunit-like protein
MASNLIVLDVETGGLDPTYHEIIQIAALIVDPITLEIQDRFESMMKPTSPERLDPQALAVNKKSPIDLEVAPEAWDVYNRFVKWATPYGRLLPVAHNSKFDLGFIDSWQKRVEKRELNFDYHSIDTVTLAYFYFRIIKPTDTKVSLTALTKLLGIPHRAHDAAGDTIACLEVLRHITNHVKDKSGTQ